MGEKFGKITESLLLVFTGSLPHHQNLGRYGSNRKDRPHPRWEKASLELTLTLAATLSRTKQERELRSVACVTTFQAAIPVSSFRRLALQKQAGQGRGS